MPPPRARTAREVIDLVIGENRFAERFCYVLIGVFVLVGVGVVIRGAATGEGVVALAGGVAGALFWPALTNLRKIRQENMVIRLLEIALVKAETSEAAADALTRIFEAMFAREKAGNG